MSFRPVGPDLRALLNEWMENPQSRRVVMRRSWERAMGDRVSRKCRPLRLTDDVLTVEVTDSSWAAQLQAMSKDLITRFNAAFGGTWVRRIEWVGEDGEPLPGPRRR